MTHYSKPQQQSGPKMGPEAQKRAQDICRVALNSLGSAKEWAELLELEGEHADRTIRRWASGEKQIPENRLIWILDGADLFLKTLKMLELRMIDIRNEVFKERRWGIK